MADSSHSPDRAPSKRTRVRRMRERGRYDAQTIHAILDEGAICHVGFSGPTGPVVIPMTYARVGDQLYLHGAAGNAALSALASGAAVCVTVTLLDALVLARSAFHHSMNYRSVVIFGAAAEVTDADEKRRALLAVVDHVVPGRSTDARPPTAKELRATRVMRLAITEASAKIRTGGWKEEPEDEDWAIWTGEVPLRLVAGGPVADQAVPKGTPAPSYLTPYRRPGARHQAP